MSKIPFAKPALTIGQQLQLLQQRGLAIADPTRAAGHLQNIGYYRLSGYTLPFQHGGNGANRHQFTSGANLDEIIDLYIFDRKLRLLFLDALERIEIAIRSALSGTMSLVGGPHWYLDAGHFEPYFDHVGFLDRTKKDIGHAEPKRRDIFIEHYYSLYSTPETPPSWMLFEALPFGSVSMAVKWLNRPNRTRVGRTLNLVEPAIKSWPHSLSYTRNLCAHHSRIWNRTFTIKPYIIKQYATDMAQNDRIYAQLVVAQIFMKIISPGSDWPQRLAQLFQDHPLITPQRLSFPLDWQNRPVWL